MESKVPIEGTLKTLAGHCSCKILKSFARELATIRQPRGCWDLYDSTGLENIPYLPHIYHLSNTQHAKKYINWSPIAFTPVVMNSSEMVQHLNKEQVTYRSPLNMPINRDAAQKMKLTILISIKPWQTQTFARALFWDHKYYSAQTSFSSFFTKRTHFPPRPEQMLLHLKAT